MQRSLLYYQFKPLIPWKVRMEVRRALARKTRVKSADVWPISEAAKRTPEGWPGWPEGKRFAFVLTHDVEGLIGLAKYRQLMQLDMMCGFRSSFNLIPEGEYTVPRELLEELKQNGFEVGVHDLHHDGKLYRSRTSFSKRAKQINHYLREWGACGFRSGFMHHRLEWYQDLDIAYDASTFDTDPFEPQPDNVNTIFPFWMKGPNGRGWAELPYTLPQDSSMFLLLRETSSDIWKRKLAWIVANGGMVLLDTHPDYMNFGDKPLTRAEYPSVWYQEFLEHVATKYAGQFWHALPRDVAAFCAKVRPVGRSYSHKRIGMITHSIYASDNRVRRYAESLAGRGDVVDVFSLKRDATQPDLEIINGVNVHRVQQRAGKNEKNLSAFFFPLLRFWIVSSSGLTRKHLRKRYHLVHVHNLPDFLVFAAWLPRISGTRIILDIHDVVPEFYASKFHLAANSPGVKILKLMEWASAAFAHHVIISNHLWYKKFILRSAPETKCSVYVNNVDQTMFYRRTDVVKNGKVVVMFPGGLQWHQGLDLGIRALATVRKKVPQAEFHIYGDGNMKDELMALAKELDLTEHVRFFNPLPTPQIAEVMATADLGIVPKRADSFGNEAYSTKIMEFMSLGVPVVVSNTKIDRYYFNDNVVRFFESGDHQALAEAMLDVLCRKGLRDGLVEHGLTYAVANSWDTKKVDYLELVDSLTTR
ncbi:MAG TPA: glycosyltransferase [Verrucomicrobiae bacterium]|nr:glycosyltransferase [Verrucomicrobiae bacterium]